MISSSCASDPEAPLKEYIPRKPKIMDEHLGVKLEANALAPLTSERGRDKTKREGISKGRGEILWKRSTKEILTGLVFLAFAEVLNVCSRQRLCGPFGIGRDK